KAARDLDLGVELPRQLEVAVHAQPRAGAVRAVFVKHQPPARHDVEHALRHGARHVAAVGTAAVVGPAALPLRPQAMQYARQGPSVRGAALRIAPLLADSGTVGGAPGEHQQVVVEGPRPIFTPRAIAIMPAPRVAIRRFASARALSQRAARGNAKADQ